MNTAKRAPTPGIKGNKLGDAVAPSAVAHRLADEYREHPGHWRRSRGVIEGVCEQVRQALPPGVDFETLHNQVGETLNAFRDANGIEAIGTWEFTRGRRVEQVIAALEKVQ